MTSVLITGSTGFVGSQIMSLLANTKIEIVLVVREGKENKYRKLSNVKKIISTNDLFKESIDWWENACNGVDLVLHTAWYMEPGKCIQSKKNYECLSGSLNLIKGATKAKIKRFVGVGTCFEYDLTVGDLSIDTPLKPNSLYGASKALLYLNALDWFSRTNIDFVWCRLFYLYGENESPNRLVKYIRTRLENRKYAELTNGDQIRDFLDISRACEMIIELMCGDQVGPVNICSENPMTVRKLAENIADEYGRRDLLKFGKRQKKIIDPQRIVGISNFVYRK